MKVILVKRNNIPISIGAGKYCFELINNQVQHNKYQESGAKYNSEYHLYCEAFALATLAWEIQEFDIIENHVGGSFVIQKISK